MTLRHRGFSAHSAGLDVPGVAGAFVYKDFVKEKQALDTRSLTLSVAHRLRRTYELCSTPMTLTCTLLEVNTTQNFELSTFDID